MTAASTPSPARSVRAFTLVELVLVLTLVGAGAMIAAPRYSRSLADARLRAAAGQVAARLDHARAAAAATRSPVTVAFDAAAGTATPSGLPAGANPQNGSPAAPLRLHDDPLAVKIDAVAFGNRPGPTFDAWGTPDGGGWVTLGVGSRQLRVTVDAGSGSTEILR
ncbi:GspH/FimT family pseudopilin [Phycisphaera mikurensis]|uniref:Type II secretion system protein H n=1 Tax=Phycisphaera mikurensis (strain NBRC 102666 / KCTC 22515 / FYK2301M01) TaxID=1142394 RepID=I0II75_PHYMF|nr:GspH/FimT family pseudopilin [Phycisphaera mikurensis]MBB6442474.1 prepilin-type N-terminal cleavage/methylation domain-containing protein [Phycisphaera mikurensis]BAM04963.1 putative fimbrial protein [Phycisphaera mikurensis NBRC 102666]